MVKTRPRATGIRAGCLLILALVATACGRTADSPDQAAPTGSTTTSAQATDEEPTPRPLETDGEAPLPGYLQPELPINERVDDLLARMTLAEKIGQMTLVQKNAVASVDIARLGLGALLSGGGGSPLENTPDAWAQMVHEFQTEALGSRLGIPLLYGIDAVHGHSNVHGAVIFPHNIGLGAANDADLMERIGQITAREMLATNIHWNYAPAVSVPRDIRWGRTYEGFSEETDRVTELATAYLRGLQGRSLSDTDTVLATLKHFVGDGGTAWGSSTTSTYRIDQGVTEIDETELRAIHLPPYEVGIAEGAMSIMASYSSWGGDKMHAQHYLLTDVLKDELGFAGFVVSDWEAIDQVSDDYYEAVVRSINAGIDMNMVPNLYPTFIETLTSAVEAGDVAMSRIDDAVRRILATKFALGLFEQPFGDPALLETVGSADHRAVAREAAAKSAVLLRNEGDMLPLSPDVEHVYVGGRAADDIGRQSGGWTIEWQGGLGPITEGTTILDGIREAVSPDTQVVFARDGVFDAPDPTTCIAVVGENPYAEGLGDDAEPTLPARDLELLDTMRGQCEVLAVIIVSGRPLLVTELVDAWDAMVAAWLPGSEGAGVADVVFGHDPFTGTLPYTWPRSTDQLALDLTPADAEPLFPYGFGLHPEASS